MLQSLDPVIFMLIVGSFVLFITFVLFLRIVSLISSRSHDDDRSLTSESSNGSALVDSELPSMLPRYCPSQDDPPPYTEFYHHAARYTAVSPDSRAQSHVPEMPESVIVSSPPGISHD